MKLECTVTSCSVRHEGAAADATTAGWKKVIESKQPPAGHDRTHLGWCPDCATKFQVE
jgi:hypothetical protein